MILEIERRILEVKKEIKELKDFIHEKFEGRKSMLQDMREHYNQTQMSFLEGQLKVLQELKDKTNSNKY